MSKKFSCQNCGEQHIKWSGQCFACKEWNTIIEIEDSKNNFGEVLEEEKNFDTSKNRERILSDIDECDRVTGGFLQDSLNLLVGSPGIGKSTLSLQIVNNISNKNLTVAVFSGEESASQIISRLNRINKKNDNLMIFSTTTLEDIMATIIAKKIKFAVIDSVQTMSSKNQDSLGQQIKIVTESLMHFAKKYSVCILLIGQVTKDNQMAGPQSLAHLVDTVFYFESEKNTDLRFLRSTKNRFGSTDEIGVFAMTEKGLSEVKNPSESFLSGRLQKAIGSSIFPSLEGQRSFLMEIQALTNPTPFGIPKRAASGFSLNRLAILIAALEKYTNINLSSYDVFINIVGGTFVKEYASDLPVCLAIISSKIKIEIKNDLFSFGEVGLSGEVRMVKNLEKRLKEAEKLNFKKAIIPFCNKKIKTNLELIMIKTINEAVDFFKK